MPPAESRLRTNIVKALRKHRGEWFVTHADAFGVRGVPDILGCADGTFYGLEVKRPGKLHTLTAQQRRTIDRITAAGGVAGVVTTVAEAVELVFPDARYRG